MASGGLAGLKEQASEYITDFTVHWNRPAKGNFVNYKELVGFSAGKGGYYAAIGLVSCLGLDTANTLLGQTLGVEPTHLQVMSIINGIVCFFITMWRSHVIDNSNHRDGKFRHYARTHGIPVVAIGIIVVWFPYSLLPNGGISGSGYWAKVAIIMGLFLCMQVVWPFWSLAFDDIIKVMSPNSQERQSISAYSTILWSLAPTIYKPILTMVSGMFPDRTVDLRFYRYAYAILSILGLALSYVTYYSTRERIVQSRAHINQINLIQSIQAVSKNKNFWLLAAAGWLGFLENVSGGIWDWAYNYQKRYTPAQRTIVELFIGNAGLLANLFTPPMTKRFGKRAILIVSNLLNIVLLAVTYKTYTLTIPFALFRFLNFLLGCMQTTIGPAIDADVRDEQHYISGERIDGVFALVGYVGTFIGMGTGFVTPALQRAGGVYKGNGGVDSNGRENMWFALTNAAVYHKMSKIMIVASVIGATLNVLPMFFYDLTEKKQRAITRVLRLRALLEDYGNGIATPAQIAEGAEIIRQAQADHGAAPIAITGNMTAKERRETRLRNDDISVAHYVIDELHKFDTPEMQRKVALARQVMQGGLEGLYHYDDAWLKKARSIKDPKLRKLEVRHCKELRRAYGNITRCYPLPHCNITEPDIKACEALYEAPQETREQLRKKNAAIKVMEAERSKFNNSARPFVNARRLLRELENQAHLDAIFAQYQDAVTQAAENERMEEERAMAQNAARKQEIARLKAERAQEKERRRAGK
ncbi:MAG: MFS transporter [Oscillospiraceae bacterium]|jgi:Na+/melibiose symporter-like transporter|nr:MFS transporter [Oscillospiraceae bacterium]